MQTELLTEYSEFYNFSALTHLDLSLFFLK